MFNKHNALIDRGISCYLLYIKAMKQKLTNEELFMLARLKKIDSAVIARLQECLDPKKVRAKLIQYEFTCLAREKVFKKGHIIRALMDKYGVSKSYIEQIIYERMIYKTQICVRCGRHITAYKWGRNNGVCDSCINKAIKKYEYEPDNENDIAQTDEVSPGSEYLDTLS